MKLLVIIMGLLIERFLHSTASSHKFQWFGTYANSIYMNTPKKLSNSPWFLLLYTIAPILLSTAVIFYLFSNLLFGFVSLLLNLIIFYYCLGPNNPFDKNFAKTSEKVSQEALGNYFANANGQLFAVIFWYIIAGPLGVLAYRLISVARTQTPVDEQANVVTNALDWIPSKVTALLYLLVGNFHIGFQHFTRLFFTPPHNNQNILSICGLHAVGYAEQDEVLSPQAEVLVEQATIVFLVLLALFTLVAWI